MFQRLFVTDLEYSGWSLVEIGSGDKNAAIIVKITAIVFRACNSSDLSTLPLENGSLPVNGAGFTIV
jgi:hypothetical protein